MNSPRRNVITAAWVAAALMIAGVVSLYVAQAAWSVVLQKTPTPLQKPLVDLPRQLHDWIAVGVDQRLSPETVQVLGTHNYLLRKYALVGSENPLDHVALNLNYYSGQFTTPHVPNVCWAGIGDKRVRDVFITVHHVRHANGTYSDLKMRFLSFSAPQHSHGDMSFFLANQNHTRLLNVAYAFQVNGAYVANPQQIAPRFWDTDSKYAYDAKIEVTVEQMCKPKRAEKAIKKFVRASLASIERCLPDWKKLNAKKPVTVARTASLSH